MPESQDNQLNIKTSRCYNNDYNQLKQEIKKTEQSLDNIVNWLIKTKCRIKTMPINMRKLAEYAKYVKQKIIILPLILRKRALYERLIRG